jgi:hypothetical protein
MKGLLAYNPHNFTAAVFIFLMDSKQIVMICRARAASMPPSRHRPEHPCRSVAGQRRRSRRNFSRKRPEATSLNHQYAMRRVFMRRR